MFTSLAQCAKVSSCLFFCIRIRMSERLRKIYSDEVLGQLDVVCLIVLSTSTCRGRCGGALLLLLIWCRFIINIFRFLNVGKQHQQQLELSWL